MAMNLSCSQCGQVLSSEREGESELCSACAAKFAVHLANLGEDSTLGDRTMDGQSIAHYEVTGKLGEGGMGEVYRARDTKLGRDVAIKILPDGMATNVQVLSRFEREAKVLAALNHPNIATIYGIEEVEDSKAIVMELVEGETLGERLRKGAMAVEECLPVFRQIASALEAAHEKGIIHRDLKPGNIKFTADNQVKVLDFGLAKPTVEADEIDTEAETAVADTTVPGSVLGTPAYMSPEQTRGEAVDKRTDVWAFGCCLYECLTGRKPFQARTISEMMAEVLKSDPDFTIVPAETPNDILSLLRRCLEKEPRRRLRDIGDIAIRLEETTETSRSLERSPAISQQLASSRSRTPQPLVLAAVLVLIALAIGLASFIAGRVSPNVNGTIQSLVILPFENAKPGDSESQWLSRTLHEALKNQLRSLERLEIKPAGFAGVDATVQGTFVREGEELHVTVSLVNHLRQTEEALGNFTKPASDIFQLQSDIAITVAEEIRSNLSDEERTRIAKKDDIVPGAYIAFRKGLQECDKFTAEGFKKAEAFYQESRLLDPNYVDPIVGAASVKWVQTNFGDTGLRPKDGFAQAKKIIAEAMQVDATHSEVLAEGGWIAMVGDRQWKKSADLFRQAIEADPDDSDGHQGLAWYFALVDGDYATALSHTEKAIALEPKRANNLETHAVFLRFSGEYEKALSLHNTLHERASTEWHNLNGGALCLLELGRLEEAKEMAMEAVRLSGRNATTLTFLAKIHVAMENREEAEALRDELIERSSREYVPAFSALALG